MYVLVFVLQVIHNYELRGHRGSHYNAHHFHVYNKDKKPNFYFYYPCMNVVWIKERVKYRERCMCLYCENCRGDVNRCRVHMESRTCVLRSMCVSSFERSLRFRNLKSLQGASKMFLGIEYRVWIDTYIDPDRFWRNKMIRNPFLQMLVGFDRYMQGMFDMHQHLVEVYFHPTDHTHVQCRKFCSRFPDPSTLYYYRCADEDGEEEPLPAIEELIRR